MLIVKVPLCKTTYLYTTDPEDTQFEIHVFSCKPQGYTLVNHVDLHTNPKDNQVEIHKLSYKP